MQYKCILDRALIYTERKTRAIVLFLSSIRTRKPIGPNYKKKTLYRPSGGPSLPTGNKRTPCRSKRYENQNAINGLKTETYYVTLAKNQKFIKIVKPNFIH